MKERLLTAAGAILLAVSVVLVIWQGSFTFGDYAPTSIEQTYLFWAASTFIFLLMVTLGFMLFRTVVRLYIERQANRERTGIKAKMVIGALVLSFLPVFFMVLFSISVLNRNLDKWFSRPAEQIQLDLVQISESLRRVVRENARAHAEWLAARPELEAYLRTGEADQEFFDSACRQRGIGPVYLHTGGGRRLLVCGEPEEAGGPAAVSVELPLEGTGGATLSVTARVPVDLAAKQQEIDRSIAEYEQLRLGRKATRSTYLLLLALITLFILFVATWVALFLAKQINVPIAALLAASDEVRRGNLSYRVDVPAIDELASLVKSFNEMTAGLERNAQELERRRRFIEAILDNVPTGVVSVSSKGEIQRVNRALPGIFSAERVRRARRLPDLLPPEQAPEVRYLMKRARRTGVASRQFELRDGGRTLHLNITVSALGEKESPGFVVVIEDTTELLRAQKSAAWREVARRVAHEIKNPLTPITLSAQRIARQVERAGGGDLSEDVVRILKECAATIVEETESVRSLVNEFSSLARFPAAQPEPADLNEVVRSGLAVFDGRLPEIEVELDLAGNLPPVRVDRELFKRVIVNLVDNSAEAMEQTPVKRLTVRTRPAGADAVELEVADTGCGVSLEDKEKLFLPYFSTKERGTGLGLAIVSQIVAEHGGHIRVEDNKPSGARFLIEVPVLNGPRSPADHTPGIKVGDATERS